MTQLPNQYFATQIVTQMTPETVISSTRLTTGDQYYVFAVITSNENYILRMTTPDDQAKFEDAIYWQNKLIPLGIPLAPFIKTDLEGVYSSFPALLMKQLPGDDLCNVYPQLTEQDKQNLAREVMAIHARTQELPDGPGYGMMSRYEQTPAYSTWYDFLISSLYSFVDTVKQNHLFDDIDVDTIVTLAHDFKSQLLAIPPRPFLWDVSDHNVLVDQGHISGIIDVDDICFGDHLCVIALTAVALKLEGYDCHYADYWANNLQLNEAQQHRLIFYRLYYCVMFMRKHAKMTPNQKTIEFDVSLLKHMFTENLNQLQPV